MALLGRSSTVLRVGILLSSSGTHSIGPVSDIAGRSELGSVDICDGEGGGVASYVDVVGALMMVSMCLVYYQKSSAPSSSSFSLQKELGQG